MMKAQKNLKNNGNWHVISMQWWYRYLRYILFKDRNADQILYPGPIVNSDILLPSFELMEHFEVEPWEKL